MSQEQEPIEGISDGERAIYDYAQTSPTAANDPEVKKVVEKVEAFNKGEALPPQDQEQEIEKTFVDKKETQESTPEPTKEETTDEETVSFFNQKPKSTGLSFNEEVAEAIKGKYSIEDTDTFFNSVDKWRKDSQDKVAIEKEYQSVVDMFAQLPDGLNDMIQAFSRGEDWRSVAVNSVQSMDYSKPFESQDHETLVKTYMKDLYAEQQAKLAEGDIDSYEFKDNMKKFSTYTKSLYGADQKEVTSRRDQIQQEQQEKLERLSSSAKDSLETFRDANPIFGQKEYRSKLDKISKDLDGNNISKYFVDKDGTWRKDAVERLFYAVYGREEAEKALSNARKDAASEAKKEVVDRGNKKPNVKSSQQQGMTEEQMMNELKDKTFVGSTLSKNQNNPFGVKRG